MKTKDNVKKHNKFLQWWMIVILGLMIRVVLHLLNFHETLQRRVELVNPITSWYRVKECMTLSKLNISPYSGDICHQPPLLVMFFKYLPTEYIAEIFMVLDILTALILYRMAKIFTHKQLEDQQKNLSKFAAGTSKLLIVNIENIPHIVMTIYIICPFTIMNCIAQSTIVVNNLFTALTLLAICEEFLCVASICVALLTYLSLYPIVLLVPVLLYAYKLQSKVISILFNCLFTFTMAMIALLVTSSHLYESWDFLTAVYGFILRAPDLTPNMGLFWYFFLEMFDHFRLFFLCIYQINIFIYAIPLAVVFRKHPILVFYALLSLIGLFKSYSNFADLSITLSMLPLWSYVFRYMRNFLLVALMLFFAAILAPSMWHLWIYAGSGNANFFYAITLVYCTAQVFLLSDILYAFLRHNYHLDHGMSPKTSDGKQGYVVMK